MIRILHLIVFIAFLIEVPLWHAAAAEGTTLVEAGIPALSREWSGDDYMQASKVLATGKLPLPRLTDEEGRRFIQRLTAKENFSLYRNRTLPFQLRMDNFFNLTGGANAIVKQYMAASSKGEDVHRELAQQLAFMLRITAIGVQLIDEFMPTIAKDEKYPVRMAGLKQFQGGLMTVFAGTETSLSETRFYSPDDISTMLASMAETLPAVKKLFAPDYKIELRKKLESRLAAASRSDDVQKIQRMIDELGN